MPVWGIAVLGIAGLFVYSMIGALIYVLLLPSCDKTSPHFMCKGDGPPLEAAVVFWPVALVIIAAVWVARFFLWPARYLVSAQQARAKLAAEVVRLADLVRSAEQDSCELWERVRGLESKASKKGKK